MEIFVSKERESLDASDRVTTWFIVCDILTWFIVKVGPGSNFCALSMFTSRVGLPFDEDQRKSVSREQFYLYYYGNWSVNSWGKIESFLYTIYNTLYDMDSFYVQNLNEHRQRHIETVTELAIKISIKKQMFCFM